MKLRRTIWCLSILLAAGLYLFENNAGTLAVLLVVVLLPILGLFPLFGNKVTVQMQMDTAPEKGQTAKGVLTLVNGGIAPLPWLSMTLHCRNLRTGEAAEQFVEVSLLPKQRKSLPFTMDRPHCGKIELTLQKVSTCDLFGLFAKKLSVSAGGSLTVLPTLFAPDISLESVGSAMPDSDTYSQVKPGNDPSETFSIREYIPGDAIRKIHWKLSEKTDRTMVREFGLPVVNEVALLLETVEADDKQLDDAITEVFASVSYALAEAGVSHHVFWRDSQSNELMKLEVNSGEDFAAMLESLLELPTKKDGSVAYQFTQNYDHCPYSHVIIVGSRIPHGVRDLYNGNRVSILLPQQNDTPEGLQPDGTYVLSFTADGYATELCRLEV